MVATLEFLGTAFRKDPTLLRTLRDTIDNGFGQGVTLYRGREQRNNQREGARRQL